MERDSLEAYCHPYLLPLLKPGERSSTRHPLFVRIYRNFIVCPRSCRGAVEINTTVVNQRLEVRGKLLQGSHTLFGKPGRMIGVRNLQDVILEGEKFRINRGIMFNRKHHLARFRFI